MSKSIASRIEWCQRLSVEACAPLEIAEWRAEAEGLRDALLHSDHTTQYQQGPPSVFERYATGLQDGRISLRIAAVPQQFAPLTRIAIRINHDEARQEYWALAGLGALVLVWWGW